MAQAERTVVGGLLVNPAAIVGVEAILDPRHFEAPELRSVYEAILATASAGRPVDLVTVRDEMQSAGTLDQAGVPFLAALVDDVSRAENVEWHARIVRNQARRRQARKVAESLIRDLDEGDDLDVVIDRHQGAMGRLVDGGDRRVIGMAAAVKQAVRSLDAFVAADNGVTGISTGLPDLDRGLGGLRDGCLYVVAARTGRGKSAFLAQLAVEAAFQGKRTLIDSMEMEPSQLAERMLLAHAEVDRWDLKPHNAGQEYAWSKIGQAEARLSTLPIAFDPRESPNLAQVRSFVRQQKAGEGVSMLVVDYIQRMSVDTRQDRWLAVGDLAKGLKSLARQAQIPVIAACQLNADAEERRPTTAMLGQAQSIISAEADVIMFLHPDDLAEWKRQPFPIVHCYVDKNRWGPSLDVQLSFEKACSRFVPVGRRG